MADITISVAAPGASESSKQLDQVAASAIKATAAAQKMTSQVKASSSAMEGLRAAAQRWRKETQEGISRGSVIGGMPGGGRMASDISSLVLSGGGMSKIAVGATAATAVVGVALEAMTKIVDQNKETYRISAEGVMQFARTVRAAQEQLGAQGLAAAHQYGDPIRSLAAAGNDRFGMSYLDRAQILAKRIPGALEGMGTEVGTGRMTDRAIDLATQAYHTGQISFPEALHQAVQGYTSASDILSSKLGRMVTSDDVATWTRNVQNDPRSAAVNSIRVNEGLELNKGIERIPTNGVRASLDHLAATNDPLSRMLVDQSTAAREQLDVLKSIDDKMAVWEKIADAVINRGDSAANNSQRAERLNAVRLGIPTN